VLKNKKIRLLHLGCVPPRSHYDVSLLMVVAKAWRAIVRKGGARLSKDDVATK
jgi:hypothetical protein